MHNKKMLLHNYIPLHLIKTQF